MATNEGSAAAAAGPPSMATADPQDPLPESNWKYRRYFVFGLGTLAVAAIVIILGMLYNLGTEVLDVIARLSVTRDVRALDQALDVVQDIIGGLVALGRALAGIVFALLIAYLIAPSAEQAAKMLATVWAWKGGVSTSSMSRSVAPDGSTAEASTLAGPAPAPAARPVPPAPFAPTQPAGPTAVPVVDLSQE